MLQGSIYALENTQDPGHRRTVGSTVDTVAFRLAGHLKVAAASSPTETSNWIRQVSADGGTVIALTLATHHAETREALEATLDAAEKHWDQVSRALGHQLTNYWVGRTDRVATDAAKAKMSATTLAQMLDLPEEERKAWSAGIHEKLGPEGRLARRAKGLKTLGPEGSKAVMVKTNETLGPEGRSARQVKARAVQLKGQSPEHRRAISAQAGRAAWAKLTPEQQRTRQAKALAARWPKHR